MVVVVLEWKIIIFYIFVYLCYAADLHYLLFIQLKQVQVHVCYTDKAGDPEFWCWYFLFTIWSADHISESLKEKNSLFLSLEGWLVHF